MTRTPHALPVSDRPRALLLDVGDTMAFFDAAAMADALAAAGLDVAPARLDAALHPAKRHYQRHLADAPAGADPWAVLVGAVLAEAGVAAELARAALAPLRRAHLEFNFWRRVPAELPAALERARAAGLRCAVVSNSEGRLAELLARLGLAAHFEVALDSQLEGIHKPDPRIFVRALVRLGVSADTALYAGDIPEVDVLGARAAGMPGVLVDPDGRYADDPRWPRVDSVAALIDRLLELPR